MIHDDNNNNDNDNDNDNDRLRELRARAVLAAMEVQGRATADSRKQT